MVKASAKKGGTGRFTVQISKPCDFHCEPIGSKAFLSCKCSKLSKASHSLHNHRAGCAKLSCMCIWSSDLISLPYVQSWGIVCV